MERLESKIEQILALFYNFTTRNFCPDQGALARKKKQPKDSSIVFILEVSMWKTLLVMVSKLIQRIKNVFHDFGLKTINIFSTVDQGQCVFTIKTFQLRTKSWLHKNSTLDCHTNWCKEDVLDRISINDNLQKCKEIHLFLNKLITGDDKWTACDK